MQKLNEYVEKIAGIVGELTGNNIDIHYHDVYGNYNPYIERCEDFGYHQYALEEMLYDGPFTVSKMDEDEIRLAQVGNGIKSAKYAEDVALAEYILNKVDDYEEAWTGGPDELCYVKMYVEDKLVDFFTEAVDAIVDEANKMIEEIEDDPIRLFSIDEMLHEFRRRGHYETDCIFPELLDMNPDIKGWAESNDMVDLLMDEWIESYTEMVDWSDIKSEALEQAAEKLGYEPQD